eukprot:TRINITY_DN18542_c0_g1_i1.p1 TRINITY_DN18542_c0_g1~~TRINITY_DN18542_c0_g1_i1.p1  ORF type:complete len:152 (-),score=26.87 TRINITY_DN18542_c0_g1_i1:53-466(-)
MIHSATLHPSYTDPKRVEALCKRLRLVIHKAMTSGKGTRDLAGPEGLTTEQFIRFVAERMDESDSVEEMGVSSVAVKPVSEDIDFMALKDMFQSLDTDNDGVIHFDEFAKAVVRLNVQPRKSVLGEEQQENLKRKKF